MDNVVIWTLKCFATYWIEDETGKEVPLTNPMNSYHLMNEAMVEAKRRGIKHIIIVDEEGKQLRNQQM